MAEKTLFDKLYEGAEATIKAIKAPLVERSMKRSFQSAYDHAEKLIDDSDISLLEERQKLKDCDVNRIVELHEQIEEAQKLRTLIKKEYVALFNEELK